MRTSLEFIISNFYSGTVKGHLLEAMPKLETRLRPRTRPLQRAVVVVIPFVQLLLLLLLLLLVVILRLPLLLLLHYLLRIKVLLDLFGCRLGRQRGHVFLNALHLPQKALRLDLQGVGGECTDRREVFHVLLARVVAPEVAVADGVVRAQHIPPFLTKGGDDVFGGAGLVVARHSQKLTLELLCTDLPWLGLALEGLGTGDLFGAHDVLGVLGVRDGLGRVDAWTRGCVDAWKMLANQPGAVFTQI